MATNKLQNIKAIKQLLAGEHRTQTRKQFYFGDADANREKATLRKVGDRWIEEDSKGIKTYYEQKQGYRVKSAVSWEQQERDQQLREELRIFKNCPKETCTCKKPSRLDSKFRILRGLCFDCNVELETRMKIRGEYNDFAKGTVKENAKAFFKDMEAELEKWKADIRGKHSFANGDGTIEEWAATAPDTMIEKIESEFNELKDYVLNSDNLKSEK